MNPFQKARTAYFRAAQHHPRITLRQVNEALAKVGEERLYRGKGYFYFAGGDAARWPSSSVEAPRLSDLTVEQWVKERNEKASQ